MGTSVQPAKATDIQQTVLAEPFTFQFFLTVDELNEAAGLRKTFLNSRDGKILGRIVCGLGVPYFLLKPYFMGTNWTDLLHADPVRAFFLLSVAALDLWVVTGQIGVRWLNARMNKLDLVRQIVLSDAAVHVTHGAQQFHRKWNEFRWVQETPNLFVLQTLGRQFWTLPKRVIPNSRRAELELFLKSKLPQK